MNGERSSPRAADGDRYLFLFALRTFRRLLVSFALPLLLPLLVSSVVYTTAIAAIEGDAARANEAVLSLMKRVVDGRLRELAVAADQLSLNEELQSVAVAAAPLSSSQRLVMSSVQALLRQSALANGFVDGIYLYLPKCGYVLSNVSRYAEGEFGFVSRERFGIEEALWKKERLSAGYRSFRVTPGESSESAASFAFSQKVVFHNSGTIPAVLVFQVNGRRFLELLDSFKWNPDSFLAVVAQDGAISPLIGDAKAAPALEYAAAEKTYSAKRSETAKGPYFVSAIGSDVADWRYVYSVPARSYSRSADIVKTAMAAYLLVCLAAGLVLSFFLARREYTPIRRLSRMFLDRLGDSGRKNDGDFSYLEDALRDLLREHDNLEDLIRRQNGTVRNGLLSRLLRGGAVQFDSLLESCRACGIEFPSQRCLVIAVSISEGKGTLRGEGAPSEIDTGALVRYMLQPVLDELLSGRAAGFAIETQAGIRCIVSLVPEEDPERFFDGIVPIAERIRALFAERFGIGLCFAVSRLRDSLSSLPISAAEADELIESLVFYDRTDAIVCAGDAAVSPEQTTAVGSSLALHRSIADSAAAGDFSAVRESVFRFLDSEVLAADLPLQTAKLRAYAIVNIIMESLQEMRPALDSASIDELKPVERLSRVRSIAELKSQVDALLRALEELWAGRDQESSPDLKNAAVGYVEANFRDRNLNVNAVADALGVSVPHLSRSFKKATGLGLLDYIHLVRIREAKRLMKENKHGIGDIALMVGCGSRVTLVRAFKRYEGATPSVFRDMETN